MRTDVFEGLGIGEGVGIAYVTAIQRVADRDLGDLAVASLRDVRHGGDQRGHVTRRGSGPDSAADGLDQLVGELAAVAHHDEQDDANIVAHLLTNHDTLEDLVNTFDLAVDLRRADAHAARVERGVGSTVDDVATVCVRVTKSP